MGIPGFEPAWADNRQDSRDASSAVDISLFDIATVGRCATFPFVTFLDETFDESEEIGDDVLGKIRTLEDLVKSKRGCDFFAHGLNFEAFGTRGFSSPGRQSGTISRMRQIQQTFPSPGTFIAETLYCGSHA
jgi:hypothetical protein